MFKKNFQFLVVGLLISASPTIFSMEIPHYAMKHDHKEETLKATTKPDGSIIFNKFKPAGWFLTTKHAKNILREMTKKTRAEGWFVYQQSRNRFKLKSTELQQIGVKFFAAQKIFKNKYENYEVTYNANKNLFVVSNKKFIPKENTFYFRVSTKDGSLSRVFYGKDSIWRPKKLKDVLTEERALQVEELKLAAKINPGLKTTLEEKKREQQNEEERRLREAKEKEEKETRKKEERKRKIEEKRQQRAVQQLANALHSIKIG